MTIGTSTKARRRRARQTLPSNVVAPYQPYPWQVAFWQDKTQVVLLTGSAGGGKSRAGLEKVHAFMLKYPGATGLMLRKAREYALKSLVPMMHRSVMGRDPAIHMLKSETLFEYPNDSVLYWGGMKNDEQREAIRSIGGEGGLDIILMEEATAFSEDDFNELLARLRGTAATWRQIILMTNPDSPTHWIYKRLIAGREASVHYSSAVDNPANPADYIDTLKKLTGVLGLRLRDGKWVIAEGAVYDYDPAVHVIDWFEPPAGWRRIRSIDFGYTNPFVCQWWALDDDERLYLYRELYMSQRIVADHAGEIARLTAHVSPEDWAPLSADDRLALARGTLPGAWADLEDDERDRRLARIERIEATIADHDAEDRATLERHGIYTQPAIKEVKVGIQAVQQRLRTAGDGRPRLFLMAGSLIEEDTGLGKKPKSTQEEFPGYAWSRPREGQAAKEEPVKVHDHGMDATRYAVMYVDRPRSVVFG